MSKAFLIIIGLGLLIMGILALFPSLEMATEPLWHAWVKIIVGAIAFIIALADKKDKPEAPQTPAE
ncbi:MAG: hypothetical protein ABIE68_04855 [bacterium]